jgi:hypothetical protein
MAAIAGRASSALPASPTTTTSPISARSWRSRARAGGSSSTKNARITFVLRLDQWHLDPCDGKAGIGVALQHQRRALTEMTTQPIVNAV